MALEGGEGVEAREEGQDLGKTRICHIILKVDIARAVPPDTASHKAWLLLCFLSQIRRGRAGV